MTQLRNLDEVNKTWGDNEHTAQYLAQLMMRLDPIKGVPGIDDQPVYCLREALTAHTCQCGCKGNIWAEPGGFCPQCGDVTVTCWSNHTILHESPDYGPTVKTLDRARQIAAERDASRAPVPRQQEETSPASQRETLFSRLAAVLAGRRADAAASSADEESTPAP